MNIPKKLRVKGKLWKVCFVDDLSEDSQDLQGLADPDSRTITICNSVPADKVPFVFMHELIHAILHELHVTRNTGSLPDLVEEILCDGVAEVLLELFELDWKKAKTGRKQNEPRD